MAEYAQSNWWSRVRILHSYNRMTFSYVPLTPCCGLFEAIAVIDVCQAVVTLEWVQHTQRHHVHARTQAHARALLYCIDTKGPTTLFTVVLCHWVLKRWIADMTVKAALVSANSRNRSACKNRHTTNVDGCAVTFTSLISCLAMAAHVVIR